MESLNPVMAVVGGVLIGAASTLLLALNGRIAGNSGMIHQLLPRTPGDALWRVMFLVGLAAGSALYVAVSGRPLPDFSRYPLALLFVGGALVGIGTRMGNGCTSGHGVCGLARLSTRSLAATLTFMAAGIVTVYVLRHVAGVL